MRITRDPRRGMGKAFPARGDRVTVAVKISRVGLGVLLRRQEHRLDPCLRRDTQLLLFLPLHLGLVVGVNAALDDGEFGGGEFALEGVVFVGDEAGEPSGARRGPRVSIRLRIRASRSVLS